MKFKLDWEKLKPTISLVIANSFVVVAIVRDNYWWLIGCLVVLMLPSIGRK